MSEHDELKELRAQLAAARAPRETKQSELDAQAEKERLKQELLDEPHIQAAIDEHGNIGEGIAVLHTQKGAIILKRPKQGAWRRFGDSKVTGADIRQLVSTCRVYPPVAAFDAIVEEYPAALDKLGTLACELAASTTKEASGK